MASKTDIANRALSKLGEPRVSNIDTTDTKPARALAGMWDVVRNDLLISFEWNFATKRTSLAPDGTAPAWGWTYAYTMPADFLRLREIRYCPNYEFEDNKILTDEGSTLYIKYISLITTTGSYSASFVEALAAKLAYEACEEITQSNTKKEILYRDYMTSHRAAKITDGAENPVIKFQDDEWATARL